MVVKFGVSILHLQIQIHLKNYILNLSVILGIHYKASNEGCRTELNRTHLKSKIWFSIFNLMNHIISPQNTSIWYIYIKSRETNPLVKKVKILLNGLGHSYIINNINSIKLNSNTIKKKNTRSMFANSKCKHMWLSKTQLFPECLQYGSKITLCGCFK